MIIHAPWFVLKQQYCYLYNATYFIIWKHICDKHFPMFSHSKKYLEISRNGLITLFWFQNKYVVTFNNFDVCDSSAWFFEQEEYFSHCALILAKYYLQLYGHLKFNYKMCTLVCTSMYPQTHDLINNCTAKTCFW